MKRIILITLILILSTASPTCDGGVSTKIPEVGLTYHEESLIAETSQESGRFETCTTEHKSFSPTPTATPEITPKSSLSRQAQSSKPPQDSSSPKSTYVDGYGYVPNDNTAESIPIDSDGSLDIMVGSMD